MATAGTPTVTGLILAGGRGSRFGGQDKGLVDNGDHKMIDLVIKALLPQTSQLIISANRNISDYQSRGYPVVCDSGEHFRGPLAGILAGLEAASTELVLVVPCDAPAINDDLLERLLEIQTQTSSKISIAHDGQRLQPLFMLIHRELRDGLASALNNGVRSVHEWVLAQEPAIVQFSDAAAFRNINSADELEAFETSSG